MSYVSTLRLFSGLLIFWCLLLGCTTPTWAYVEAEEEASARQSCIAQLPLDKLTDPLKAKLTKLIKNAQIFERSKHEAFPCNPEVYRWLLESPDASLYAWQRLGATKASIARLENGTFLGSDGNGSELRWHLVAAGPFSRIWYAEGSGRLGPLLPTMTIRALVFLNFQEVKGTDGRSGVKHRIDVLAQYDSIALVNKITNLSAESTGKKVVQQLELFFSGMAWYVSEHQSWSRTTFNQWATSAEAKQRAQQLYEKLDPVQMTSSTVPARAK